MTKVLYLGDSRVSSTSFHRAEALKRIGYEVEHWDPYQELVGEIRSKLLLRVHYKTGYSFLQLRLKKWVRVKIKEIESKPDFIWINSGELFGPEVMKTILTIASPVILYNNDDPTGGRDGSRFRQLLKAIPMYDLIAVMREENVREYKSRGAKEVLKVTMSYDEVFHRPLSDGTAIPKESRSEVAFLGRRMKNEGRDSFLLKLIREKIPLTIWGDDWSNSKYYKLIKPFYKGKSAVGVKYVQAIQGSKICLGLLSKGNRDLHTTRSFEIPFIGSVLCAERTKEHTDFFKEGVEAEFWADENECVAKCKKLLEDVEYRENMRIAGMIKVRSLGVGNEDICKKILNTLQKLAK